MRQAETEVCARQKGIALVAVLWLFLLLSVIATGTLREARTETNLVRNGLEAAKTRALADAGIQRAVLALLEDDPVKTWRRDGTPRRWPFAGEEVRISIRDETGKIDLNQAAPVLLKGLFMTGGVDERTAAALADAVADFRDDNHLRRLNGAEDDDYLAAGYARGAKDAPFDRVAELTQVLGMTPALFKRIAHALTVYSARPTIDPVTASREALLAVPGIGARAVGVYIAARADSDSAVGLPLPGASDFLSNDGGGKVFEVRAEATSRTGTRFVRTAILRLSSLAGAPFKIESWEQGRRQEPSESSDGLNEQSENFDRW